MRGECLEPDLRVGQLLADPLALGALLDEPPLECEEMDVRRDPRPRGRGSGIEGRRRGGRGDGLGLSGGFDFGRRLQGPGSSGVIGTFGSTSSSSGAARGR